jgi:transposase
MEQLLSVQPQRYLGLDIHKKYLVVAGVDRQQQPVYAPLRVPYDRLKRWLERDLTPQDAVVLEMTTNTWKLVDLLENRVQSVTVVHPPHVHLITRAQVMTDQKAALTLAKLHAAGLLPPVWVPPPEVRDLRALVAQRHKMVRLATQAKNRLQSVLHRYHLEPPPKSDPYTPKMRPWWEALPVSALEQVRLSSDLDTVAFSRQQIKRVERCLAHQLAQDPRLPLLSQIPGIAFINAVTLLAAIGEISRFPSASELVGYAGLGTRVHDSGQSHWTGRITKAGRRDIRRSMVEAAQAAARSHPHWKAELKRLTRRMERKKAIVAIARKLLVTVWHVLSKECADRYAIPQQVACSLFRLAYQVGVSNLPDGLSALEFTRQQLDRLGIGQEVTQIPWGSKHFKLPPSKITNSSSD